MKQLSMSRIQIIAIIIVLLISGCNTPKKQEITNTTPQEKAKESILKWIDNNKDDYPEYQPIKFDEITPRYERTDRTSQLVDLIEYEKAKPTINNEKLDSLKKLLNNNRGLLLGYTLQHRYQTTSNAGERLKHESLFFLDTSFRVATILKPEDFDNILDQKLIFKPDSTEKK
jgi:hypothetical protein